MEAKGFSENGEVDPSKMKEANKGRRNAKTAIWRKKVARYLAYCLDGGLLQRKFSLVKLIQDVDQLPEKDDQDRIHREIAYLLHGHNKENPTEIYLRLEEKMVNP